MNVEMLAAAETDLGDAVAYYNEQSEGLGYELAAEFKQTVARIAQCPQAWHPLTAGARRCRMKRFPYGVVYQLRGEHLLVVAGPRVRVATILSCYRQPMTRANWGA